MLTSPEQPRVIIKKQKLFTSGGNNCSVWMSMNNFALYFSLFAHLHAVSPHTYIYTLTVLQIKVHSQYIGLHLIGIKKLPTRIHRTRTTFSSSITVRYFGYQATS